MNKIILFKTGIAVTYITMALASCQYMPEDLHEYYQTATETVSDVVTIVNSTIENDTIREYQGTDDQEMINTTLEEVTLVSVVDGDTLWVVGSDSLEYKVRLIGIDTPESVHSDASKNNEYGTMASDHTKELLDDVETLYLEYDEEVTDIYNRVLAYVWLSPDTSDVSNMLNAKILIDGYAVNKEYAPNTTYAAQFQELCTKAKTSETGLWIYPDYIALTSE